MGYDWIGFFFTSGWLSDSSGVQVHQSEGVQERGDKYGLYESWKGSTAIGERLGEGEDQRKDHEHFR